MPPVAPESHVPPAAPPPGSTYKFFPVPVYSTSPNVGDTYGLMPVVLAVDPATGNTRSLYSPSLTWNRTTRYTATFAWKRVFNDTRDLGLTVSGSSQINRKFSAVYSRLPNEADHTAIQIELHARRDVFYRFFGLGPYTSQADESGYTRAGGETRFQFGHTFSPYFTMGAHVGTGNEIVEPHTVRGVALTTERYAGVPGVSGAATLAQGVFLRFDTRREREFSERGFESELSGDYVHGFDTTPDFTRLKWETRALIHESHALQGALRLFWSYAGGHDVPFYDQSVLGGSDLLRGFPDYRFTDKGAWEADLVERLRTFSMSVYGTHAEITIAPFVTAGQVYQDFDELTRRVRLGAGVGLQILVKPSFLGRLDLAAGGEGLKIYTELGYPF